jgi:hypothetical protein
MSEHTTAQTSGDSTPHKAGLFDIRIIIGSLIGLYGVILVLTGLLSSDGSVDNSKAINLWTGLALVVVSVGFILWARLRPIAVPAEAEADDRPAHH